MMFGNAAENQASESKDPSPLRKKRRFGDVLDNNDHDRVNKKYNSDQPVTAHELSGKENECYSKERCLTFSGKENADSKNLEFNRFYPKTMSLLNELQTPDQSILYTISKITSLKQDADGVQGLMEECLQAVKVVDGINPLFRSHDGTPKPPRKPLLDHNAYFVDKKFYFERL